MNREEALEMTDRGVEELIAALEQGKSEQLLEYLAFQARFHQYSFSNCLLIAIQKPDATFVAGFQRWRAAGPVRQERRERDSHPRSLGSTEVCGRDVVGRIRDGRSRSGRRLSGGCTSSTCRRRMARSFPSSVRSPAIPASDWTLLEGASRRHVASSCATRKASAVPRAFRRGARLLSSKVYSPSEEFAVLVHELAHELLHRYRSSQRNDGSGA